MKNVKESQDDTSKMSKQVEETTAATGIINPFARRDLINKTPPRLRTSSLTDLGRNRKEGSSEQPGKRKRIEESAETKAGSIVGEQFKSVLEKASKQSKQVEKVLQEMYKPKQELKEAVSKLMLLIEQLNSKRLKDWLDEVTNHCEEDKPQDTLLYENKELREKLQLMESRDTSVQCKECRETQKREARRKVLSQEKSFDAFLRITEDDWEEETFPRIEVKQGYIWDAPVEYQLILPCSKDLESENKIVKRAINKFGGREGLLNQNKVKGEMAMMSHSLAFPDEEGNFTQQARCIYYPILSNGETKEEAEDRLVFRTIQAIKEHMISQKSTKLAIPEIDGILGAVIIRMIEFLFTDTNIQICLYKAEDTQRKTIAQTVVTKPPGRPRKNTTKDTTGKSRKVKEDALLVKVDGKSYADLLKTIKQKVNPSEIGVDVKDIRKTRNGDLLLTVQNGSDKAEVLKREIKEKLPEATTSELIDKKVLHIKGLDEVVTIQEITDVISKELSVQPESFKVTALRPAYGDKQNVTVIIPTINAEKLIQMEKIKIGWTRCRIMEREVDKKCYRCWQYGHEKAQCKGPDRERLCVKCGKEGHKAAMCQNNPYCVHCKEEGHQSGSTRCPKNRSRKKRTPSDNERSEVFAN